MPSKHDASSGVRALTRGLQILCEVNKTDGIRASEIGRSLEIPRPTVYRLLETLEEMGFVQRSATDNRFRVTRRALSLGDGFTPRNALIQAAGPMLSELGKRLVWPINLTTYDNAAMVIQETTHAYSPLSIDYGMTGDRRSVLRTAAGYAYLGACLPREREIILDHVRHLNDPQDMALMDETHLRTIIDTTVRQGFGIRAGNNKPGRSGIAVAIRHEDVVFGCISLVWITSALTQQEAIETFVPELHRSAALMARRLASAPVDQHVEDDA